MGEDTFIITGYYYNLGSTKLFDYWCFVYRNPNCLCVVRVLDSNDSRTATISLDDAAHFQ